VTSAPSLFEMVSDVYTIAFGFHVRITGEIRLPDNDMLLRRYIASVAPGLVPCSLFSKLLPCSLFAHPYDSLFTAVAVARLFDLHHARKENLMRLTWKFLGGIGHLLLAPGIGRILEGFSVFRGDGIVMDSDTNRLLRIEQEMPVVVSYQRSAFGGHIVDPSFTLTIYGQNRCAVERALHDLTVGSWRFVVRAFEPESGNELALAAGDVVTVSHDPEYSVHNIHRWVYGRNESSQGRGWFPFSYTTAMEQTSAPNPQSE